MTKILSGYNGKTIKVNGVEYRAFVISSCTYLDKTVADFVIKAVGSQFQIVFTDRRPIVVIDGTVEENAEFIEKIEKCALVPSELIGTYLK